MVVNKLQNGTISRVEFEVLQYLDGRLYEETARGRFSSLDTHLDPNHQDFNLRLEVNTHLRDAVNSYIEQNIEYLKQQDKIRVIELGASMGAISSLYVLDGLYKTELADKVELTLLDICREPLERTIGLYFDLQTIYEKADFSIPVENLRKILQNARIVEENALETKQPDNSYTISLAAFTHHHLNIYDKENACRELERITTKNGGIIVGDLIFSYDEFVNWLRKHQAERNSQGQRVPYAVESFVSLEQHQDFFRNSSTVFKRQYPQHYVFAMQRGGENV
ncbi:MAG: class I SAM-dependent methyltransferase [archaeon]|nr:class I SAM-dependent methyltransferase [archaeon]